MARKFLVPIDLNKLELLNPRAQQLASAPSAPVTGQFYYDTTANRLYYYNGTGWVAADGSSVAFATPAVVLGTAAAAGSALTTIRSDATIVAFDATAPAAEAVGDAAVVGTAAVAARRDHRHAMPAFAAPAVVLGTAAAAGAATTLLRSDATIVAFDATAPSTQAIGDAAVVGTAAVAARRDHKHALPAFASPTAQTAFGATSGAGSATTLPRSDHTHGTPTHIGTDHSAISISSLSNPTADRAWGGFKITGLADPIAAQDAATKAYVDATAQGLDVKPSVRAATTANITLSGTQTVDGVALVAGNRVLVKNQTTASENGIYVVAAGAWARGPGSDTNADVTPGLFVFVEEGTLYADTGWVLTTNAPITLGTTALAFAQFSGAGAYTAGTGMTQSGTTFNVGQGAGVIVGADDVSVDATVVVRKHAASVGDGAATSFVVTHNLNTQDVIVLVRDNASPFAFMEPDIEATTANTVTVRFAVAPTTNQYRVITHA